jgi:hypothetical protein
VPYYGAGHDGPGGRRGVEGCPVPAVDELDGVSAEECYEGVDERSVVTAR